MLICAVLLSGSARSAPVYAQYVPFVRHTRPDGLGLELPDNYINLYPAVRDLGPVYLRATFGNSVDPSDTLYLAYKSGGWAAVDAQVADALEGWRAIGAEPIVVFMYGGACSAPKLSQLTQYAVFIAQAAERYSLRYFEVWNEPDATGGLASLYGCFGTAHTARLIHLLGQVQQRVPAERQVGVSFMLQAPAHLDMLRAVAPYADWVGIHHYAIWSAGQVLDPWPGDLATEYALASANAAGRPVWATEVNLRSPDDDCSPAHQAAQAEWLGEALDLGLPMVSVLVYASYPDWQCTGIRNTPAEEALRPYP